jgi:hypothetical protein
VRLVRRERRVEAAFGICKAKVSVTHDEMEEAIRSRAALCRSKWIVDSG